MILPSVSVRIVPFTGYVCHKYCTWLLLFKPICLYLQKLSYTYPMLVKLLRYLLWAEMIWVIFSWVSPWRLWSDADIAVVCTLPWMLLFFLIRSVRRQWKEEGNAAVGCLYTALWMTIPFIVAAQLFFVWSWTSRNEREELVYEDDKYRVTIVYGFFTTNTDNIRIEEHRGAFHREVYYGCLYDVDTDKLRSPAAIEAFLDKER